MEQTEKVKMSPRTLLIRIIVGIALAVGLYYGGKEGWYMLHHESTDNAQVETRMIPVLSRVSGYVQTLYVEDYASVKKDSLLAVIDDAQLKLQLQEMEADVLQAQTDILNAKAAIGNAQATVSATQAQMQVVEVQKDKAEQDFNRDQALYKAAAITQKQFDDSKASLEVSNKQYLAAQNEVRVAQSRIAVLQAQLQKAKAVLDVKQTKVAQQKLNLSYTRIYSPADGKIGKRGADEGQFIQAGTPLFTVVDDQNFWIVANYKETQIEHLKVGSPAIIRLDAYPGEEFKGTIVSLSEATGAKFSLLPPDNATGNFVKVTQRVPVKIAFTDLDKLKGKLHAGMSVEVSVKY